MVDHSSSSDFYEKDLLDLPPPKFSPGYVLRVGEWNISAPWMMAWVQLCASCVWNLRGLVFITDTSGGFAIGKSEGSLTSESRYWFHKALNFLPEKWFGFLKLKIIQVKRKIIWTIVSSICGFPNLNFPRRLRRRRRGFWSFWKAGHIGMLTGH